MSKLYEKYSDAIFGVICRIVKDKNTSEEVLQQTMLKAWNKMADYNPEKSSMYTWLNVIARSTSIDKVRLVGFKNQQKTDSFDPLVHDYSVSTTTSSKIDVAKLISGLEPKYKLILDKLYLEGYSQSDLSREFDIPLGTVKTRVKQALDILRNELKEEKNLFLRSILLTI